MYLIFLFCFFFSSRRRHTRCALVTGVQTCALPISPVGVASRVRAAAGRSPGTRSVRLEAARNPNYCVRLWCSASVCEGFVVFIGDIGLALLAVMIGGDAGRGIRGEPWRAEIGRASGRESVCQYV